MITYSTNWFMRSDSSSSVRDGEANFSLRAEACGSFPLMRERWPAELDTVDTLACGLKSGNKLLHSAKVPK